MAYKSHHLMFRSLTDAEEQEFREYAKLNDPPRIEDWFIYHPVCREEWQKRGLGPTPGTLDSMAGFFG